MESERIKGEEESDIIIIIKNSNNKSDERIGFNLSNYHRPIFDCILMCCKMLSIEMCHRSLFISQFCFTIRAMWFFVHFVPYYNGQYWIRYFRLCTDDIQHCQRQVKINKKKAPTKKKKMLLCFIRLQKCDDVCLNDSTFSLLIKKKSQMSNVTLTVSYIRPLHQTFRVVASCWCHRIVCLRSMAGTYNCTFDTVNQTHRVTEWVNEWKQWNMSVKCAYHALGIAFAMNPLSESEWQRGPSWHLKTAHTGHAPSTNRENFHRTERKTKLGNFDTNIAHIQTK